MLMWSAYAVIVIGLLEEVMYATLAARHAGGTQHLIIGGQPRLPGMRTAADKDL